MGEVHEDSAANRCEIHFTTDSISGSRTLGSVNFLAISNCSTFFLVDGLGFGVQGSRFGVDGLGFGVEGLGLRIQGSGFMDNS